jgi:hypothetical protein
MFRKKYVIAALLAVVAIAAFASLTMAQSSTATITSPANGATISGMVDITGTANGPVFGTYKVEFKSATAWVLTDGVIHNSAVTNGKLVTWDTTTVTDGNYDLRLLVADVSGQYITTQISVKVDNATAKAQAALPRRGCLACHVQIAPDGRYSLAWEAQNAVQAQGKTHPTLPNGYKTTEPECLACHASNGPGDAGVGAPISLRAIVHPAHLFSDVFPTEFKGNCFSCHDVDGTGAFKVIVDKMTVNAHGQPVLK